MTISLDTSDLLLLAPVPFLLVSAVTMMLGILHGPARGRFRMNLTWPWLWLVLPTLLAGLYGIAKAVAE